MQRNARKMLSISIFSETRMEENMNTSKLFRVIGIVLLGTLLFTACAPAATPEPAPPQAAPVEAPAQEVVEEPPVQEVVEEPPAPAEPEVVAPEPPAGPCLTIGAIYVGSVNDAGFNQAMHDSLLEVKQNLDCVEILEAENVYEGPQAEVTMETMIQQGAKLIIATSFGHQEPAMNVAKKHPDVIFEHAGGWMMDANFANFFGTPPQAFYTMGAAAGLMTESNKLCFVAAMPLGWTVTFINSFTLGAQAVNPDIETLVAFTGSWSDKAKEASATNALIDQGCDAVTMHVDAPGTVIQTAEGRGVYSLGFQSVAAQQFAPEHWLTGVGFTFGDLFTNFATQVMEGSWSPQFIRCGFQDNCMAMAPFGKNVPADVQEKVLEVFDEVEAGKVIFEGPIYDQAGELKIAAGETIDDQALGNLDWFVKGVIGQPK
jgi:basic membrane protein A and related proteins